MGNSGSVKTKAARPKTAVGLKEEMLPKLAAACARLVDATTPKAAADAFTSNGIKDPGLAFASGLVTSMDDPSDFYAGLGALGKTPLKPTLVALQTSFVAAGGLAALAARFTDSARALLAPGDAASTAPPCTATGLLGLLRFIRALVSVKVTHRLPLCTPAMPGVLEALLLAPVGSNFSPAVFTEALGACWMLGVDSTVRSQLAGTRIFQLSADTLRRHFALVMAPAAPPSWLYAATLDAPGDTDLPSPQIVALTFSLGILATLVSKGPTDAPHQWLTLQAQLASTHCVLTSTAFVHHIVEVAAREVLPADAESHGGHVHNPGDAPRMKTCAGYLKDFLTQLAASTFHGMLPALFPVATLQQMIRGFSAAVRLLGQVKHHAPDAAAVISASYTLAQALGQGLAVVAMRHRFLVTAALVDPETGSACAEAVTHLLSIPSLVHLYDPLMWIVHAVCVTVEPCHGILNTFVTQSGVTKLLEEVAAPEAVPPKVTGVTQSPAAAAGGSSTSSTTPPAAAGAGSAAASPPAKKAILKPKASTVGTSSMVQANSSLVNTIATALTDAHALMTAALPLYRDTVRAALDSAGAADVDRELASPKVLDAAREALPPVKVSVRAGVILEAVASCDAGRELLAALGSDVLYGIATGGSRLNRHFVASAMRRLKSERVPPSDPHRAVVEDALSGTYQHWVEAVEANPALLRLAEVVADSVACWEYSSDGMYVAHSAMASMYIERAYQRGDSTVRFEDDGWAVFMALTVEPWLCERDETLLGVAHHKQSRTPCRRREAGTPVGLCWKHQDGSQPVVIADVAPGSVDWVTVSNAFYGDDGGAGVVFEEDTAAGVDKVVVDGVKGAASGIGAASPPPAATPAPAASKPQKGKKGQPQGPPKRRITRATHRLVRVERVQNLYTWQQYVAQRQAMLRERGADSLNERLLFHGTRVRDPHVLASSRYGFLSEFTSKGAFYGAGFYFAEEATYVDSVFAHKAAKNEFGLPSTLLKDMGGMGPQGPAGAKSGKPPPMKQMLLVNVLCGMAKDYGKKTSTGLKRREHIFNQGFDSATGGPHFPSKDHRGEDSTVMQVVYRESQCYPQFIVSYSQL